MEYLLWLIEKKAQFCRKIRLAYENRSSHMQALEQKYGYLIQFVSVLFGVLLIELAERKSDTGSPTQTHVCEELLQLCLE